MTSKSNTEKTYGWKSDATKTRIHKAALEVFAKHGYSGASTRQIATKAKSNIALIAKYFGGKEKLFMHVVQAEISKILAKELAYPAQNSLRDELKEYIFTTTSNMEKNLNFFKITFAQSLIDKKFSRFMHETIIPKHDDRLIARLYQLKENGMLAGTSPEDISTTVRAFILGLTIIELMLVDRSDTEFGKVIDSFLKVVCRESG